MRLFLLLWLILELATFYLVAKGIGFLAAILLIIVSMAVGGAIIRSQGTEAFRRAQEKAASGKAPQSEMMQGVGVVMGGFALMIPGFLSSIIGLLLMLPGISGNLTHKIFRKGFMRKHHAQPEQAANSHEHLHKGETVEGEFERKDD
jgi:UPF0716 protein FxsA